MVFSYLERVLSIQLGYVTSENVGGPHNCQIFWSHACSFTVKRHSIEMTHQPVHCSEKGKKLWILWRNPKDFVNWPKVWQITCNVLRAVFVISPCIFHLSWAQIVCWPKRGVDTDRKSPGEWAGLGSRALEQKIHSEYHATQRNLQQGLALAVRQKVFLKYHLVKSCKLLLPKFCYFYLLDSLDIWRYSWCTVNSIDYPMFFNELRADSQDLRNYNILWLDFLL